MLYTHRIDSSFFPATQYPTVPSVDVLYFLLQIGGLNDYLTASEIPWIISLILSIVMQHKNVFKSFLVNWKSEKGIYLRQPSQNQTSGEEDDITGESLVSVMLLRALLKFRDTQSHR